MLHKNCKNISQGYIDICENYRYTYTGKTKYAMKHTI